MNQVIQRPERLIERRFKIGKMHLIQIEIVGLQTAQASMGRLEDMLARPATIIGTSAHREKELARQHNLFASPFEPVANIFFGAAHALQSTANWIGISGIKEGDPVVERFVHNGA